MDDIEVESISEQFQQTLLKLWRTNSNEVFALFLARSQRGMRYRLRSYTPQSVAHLGSSLAVESLLRKVELEADNPVEIRVEELGTTRVFYYDSLQYASLYNEFPKVPSQELTLADIQVGTYLSQPAMQLICLWREDDSVAGLDEDRNFKMLK